LSRRGRDGSSSGWADVTIEWYSYKRGASAIEGILAGTVDMTLCGTEPGDQRLRAVGRAGNPDYLGGGEWGERAGGASRMRI